MCDGLGTPTPWATSLHWHIIPPERRSV